MTQATSPVPSKSVNGRFSNMELLRVCAMFLVLVVHADFFSLGKPSPAEVTAAPLPSFLRYFFQALSIGCVDIFILISGWFGIQPKRKSFFNFIFQCLFYFFGIYAVCLVVGGEASPGIRGLADCLNLQKWNWFISAYIGLYLLAPVLNAFVEHTNEVQLRRTLIYFYVFQTIYSWIGNNPEEFFLDGYSTMSFIGLYLLARYLRLYPNAWTQKSAVFDFSVFFGIVLLHTLTAFVSTSIGLKAYFTSRSLSYVNPLLIVSCAYLVLGFSKLHFTSRVVNWLGASSFAVFLVHTNPHLFTTYYAGICKYIYEQYSGVVYLLTVFAFLVALFLASVLVDQLRIAIWKRLCPISRILSLSRHFVG